MILRALVLGLALAAPALKLDPDSAKLVDLFLKTPTAELPPERVPDFLAVDAARVSAKQRDKFEAKRIELLALKKNADGKYKPPMRLLGKDTVTGGCEPPREMSSISLLLQTGFEQITQDEEEWLMQETKCTECELRTEFSLTLVSTPPKKKDGKRQLHYLLHSMDPIMTLLAKYRAGDKSTSTAFFGISASPKCR